MKALKIDAFTIALLAAVAVAFLAPGLGADGGPLQIGLITDIGVALIFFIHGAALSTDQLKTGMTNWRLQAFIHIATFVMFPLAGLALYFGAGGAIDADVRLGFFYLCAISSTISSSVALTGLARGNVPAAVLAATVSGLAGMALTPLLLGLVTITGEVSLPLLPAVTGILIKLFAPFLIGHALGRWLRPVITAHKPIFSWIDRGVIVLIVYGAFCNSAADGLWSQYGPGVLVLVLALAAGLLALAMAGAVLAARALGFSREDEVAALFCGTQKSLANGAPIAKIIFGASPALGMIMLPLMLYHQLQLIVGGMLARRYAGLASAPGAAV